jgi:hypothetical protein
MKMLAFLLLLSPLTVLSQTYETKVTFEADLWTIDYAEEAVRPPGDTVNFTWVKRSISSRKNAIYVDLTKNNTLIGIKYPRKMTLKSEGLPNNGFIGEKWFNQHCMYRQSYARDENGNLWLVTVGKDRVWEKEEDREDGRIYISIQDVNNQLSGWYFLLRSL